MLMSVGRLSNELAAPVVAARLVQVVSVDRAPRSALLVQQPPLGCPRVRHLAVSAALPLDELAGVHAVPDGTLQLLRDIPGTDGVRRGSDAAPEGNLDHINLLRIATDEPSAVD